MKNESKKMFANLRLKAEELLSTKPQKNTIAQLSEADALKLLHELEVYEIELEMQNDEFAIVKELYSSTLRLFQEQDVQQVELEIQKEALAEARSELSETAKQYAEFYNSAASGFFTLNNVGEILELNIYGAKLLGKQKEGLIKARFGFFVSESTRLIFNQFIERVFDSYEKHTCEIVLVNADGQSVFCQLIGIINDNADKCMLTITDISERKEVEKALAENNVRLELALEAGEMAWWEMEVSTGNVIFDKQKTEMIGYSAKDFTHYTHFTALVHPEDIQNVMDAMNRLLAGETETFEVDYRLLSKSGEYIWFNDIGIKSPKSIDDNSQYVRGIVKNISLKKEKELAIQESEIKYRNLVDYSPDAIAIYMDGKLVLVNNECVRLLAATSAADLIGKSVIDFVHPDSRSLVIKRMKDISEENIKLPLAEEKFIKFDGTTVDVEVKALPLLIDNKQAIQLIVRDITNRKLADKIIRESEERYRFMFANNPLPMWVFDTQTLGFLEVNEAAILHYGYSRQEFLSMTLKDIRTEENVPALIKEIAKPIVGAYQLHGEWQHIKKNGDKIIVSITYFALKYNGRNARHVVIHDITDRKRVKNELLNTNERLESIVEGAHVGTWEWNIQTGDTIFNEIWAQFFGYTLDELAPLSIKTWQNLAHPDDLKQSETLLKRHFSGELPFYEFECRVKHKNGSWIWINDCGRVITRSEDGKPLKMFGTHTDITQRKLVEEALNLSQEELKKFASHLQHIHDEERIVLAREIHDELAQTLIAVKIDMGLLKQKVLKSTENVDISDILIKFDQLFGLVDYTIKTTGNIMTGLRPEALYLLGLNEAISLYVTKYQSKYQIDCQFENTVVNLFVDTQQSLALFRILQEALENVALHAKAKAVKIHLSTEKKNLVLEIIDNGFGFDENMSVKSETYGLISMKERARFVNGEFTISGFLGIGTTVRVEIPYN